MAAGRLDRTKMLTPASLIAGLAEGRANRYTASEIPFRASHGEYQPRPATQRLDRTQPPRPFDRRPRAGSAGGGILLSDRRALCVDGRRLCPVGAGRNNP